MFFLRAVRLVLSIALEGIYNLGALALFPLRRGRLRAQIHDLLSRVPPAVVLAAGLGVSLLASGCTSMPGSSFSEQIDNTAWTLSVLADQSGWATSLGSDLGVLFDPEWDQLPETFTLLGW